MSVGALVEAAFYPHLAGRRNLEVPARTRGVYEPRQIDELLERLDMAGRADRPVAGYSMGMKQRLGVAAALLGQPKLVLLDEPTNGLDPAGIREMRSFIRHLAEERGLAIFVSSHLLSEVEQMCDEVAILHRGRIERKGKVADLLAVDQALQIVAEPADRAVELLSHRWRVSRGDGALRAEVPAEQTPAAVQTLVAGGVEVFEVRRLGTTLERLFLEITEGVDASPSGGSRS